ncbi:hypothetical protein LTS18_007641 [Coniosporium uncinatum]|uniref:Uncharacterized protein n=1 Tax=Coniosporium uncinatum TaxID=93489 RepID=A0ACC3DPC0_9PEZI|nr:hypothetical protein LTS18_007641 [Coniosporium uncinatum]
MTAPNPGHYNVDPDEVAGCVLSAFNALPAKRKPRQREDGAREWVPLSGIVLSKGTIPVHTTEDGGKLTCAALATGMKCLPTSKLSPAKGNVLHDWHAEILAIRAFNRFLVDECADLAATGLRRAAYLRWREEGEKSPADFQPFAVKEDVGIHMYCSEAPCGDGSMELVMQEQDDATPWELPPATANDEDWSNEQPLRGRGYFSQLGIVRLKPSRPDAPPTLSKSCTDKLTLKQSTSVLSSLASLLIHPSSSYIHTLTLPSSQHVPEATTRAFSPHGRMSALPELMSQTWTGGYRFQPFRVLSTSREFEHSRRSGPPGQRMLPSNLSTAATPRLQETLIGGTLQGRKQFDPRGASRVCRSSMWAAALQVALVAGVPIVVEALRDGSYKSVKTSKLLQDRRKVKEGVRNAVLKGWTKNEGDEEWEWATSVTGAPA